MYRRSLLAATAAISVAGCTGAGGAVGPATSAEGDDRVDGGDDDDRVDGGDDDDLVDGGDDDLVDGGDGAEADREVSGDDTSEEDPSEGGLSELKPAVDPELRSTDIVETDAEGIDETGVTFSPDAVHVSGTVAGETGCHSVAVADAAVDADGEFRVVVAAVDGSEPAELCTQSLTEVGYELDAAFDDGVPESVTVVHDDAHGRGPVADARPDGE